MARNAEMRQKVVVIDPTELNAAAAKRLELPGYVMTKIDECVQEIKARYPDVTEMKLIGSYSNGYYVDDQTPIEFITLRHLAGKRVKISDFDFQTVPTITGMFETKNGHKVHLWVARNNNEGSLTWKFN